MTYTDIYGADSIGAMRQPDYAAWLKMQRWRFMTFVIELVGADEHTQQALAAYVATKE